MALGRVLTSALAAWPHVILTCFAFYFVVLLPTTPTLALSLQGKAGICGSWNNYCRGAPASPNTGNRDTGNRLYTTPRGEGWYCRARANNGAWGWGESESQERANSIAISQCQSASRGQSCRITSCRLGGGANPSAPTYSHPRRNIDPAPRRPSPAQVTKQRPDPRVDRKKRQELDLERQRQAKLAKLERDRKAREARLERERQALAAAKRRLATAVERGDYRTAVAVQAVLVNADKDDPRLWQDFARYLEKSGQLDKAATAIRQAALLAGTDASSLVSAMYQRDAVAHAASGNRRKAIAQQAMAIEASKNNAGLWLGLAEYMEKDGQLDNAAVAYRRAHMLGAPNPEDKIFAMHFEHTLTKAGSVDGGRKIEIYRSLVEKFPDARSNFARHRLAEELLKQRRTREAHDVLQRIADLDPSDKAARTRLAAIQGSNQASSVPLTVQSHGERGRGKVVSETASAAGYGTSSAAPGKQVSEPKKDIQTVTHHGRNALDATSAATAKDQAMLGFDTAGRGLAPLPTVAIPRGRGTGSSDVIPEDIGADVPAAKRQQVIAALSKSPEWAKLADRREEIETKRAEIATRRDQLDASYQSSEVRKDPGKRAAIAAEIAKAVIEDDKIRNDLHKVKTEQQTAVKKAVETVSFSVELVDEKSADDTERKETPDSSPAESVPAPQVRQ